MLFRLFPLFALAAAVAINEDGPIASRDDQPSQRTCGTVPDPAFLDISNKVGQQELALATSTGSGDMTIQAADTQNITVPLYIHVVASNKKLKGGYVPQSLVDAQVAALSAAYNPQGVYFDFQGADWTVNRTWAKGHDDNVMSARLRKGGYDALNLYFLKALPNRVLGFCYFPVTPRPKPGSVYFDTDGCRVVSWSMPGGSPGGEYNLGATAVHEAGHWFGLMHPFQGTDCTSRGDYVADTPAQKTPSYGCPVTKDSCPDQKGLDNVRNFMDYSDDSCYTGFSAGQRKRLMGIWKEYRAKTE